MIFSFLDQYISKYSFLKKKKKKKKGNRWIANRTKTHPQLRYKVQPEYEHLFLPFCQSATVGHDHKNDIILVCIKLISMDGPLKAAGAAIGSIFSGKALFFEGVDRGQCTK